MQKYDYAKKYLVCNAFESSKTQLGCIVACKTAQRCYADRKASQFSSMRMGSRRRNRKAMNSAKAFGSRQGMRQRVQNLREYIDLGRKERAIKSRSLDSVTRR